MRSSSRLLVAVTTVTLLAACTGPAGSEDAPATAARSGSAPFTEVAVPDALQPAADAVLDASAIAATGDRPGLVVARVASPGTPSHLGLWTLTGGNPNPATIDADLPGALDSVAAAGSDEVAAITGSTWSDGRLVPFALTSADRATWTAAPLGTDLEGVSLTAAAAEGGTVVAAGVDASSDVRVVVLEGGEARDAAVATDDGRAAAVSGVAVAGDEVLVVGSAGEAGQPAPVVAWLSQDGGASFGAAVTVSADEGAVGAGVVRAEGTWVVTGVHADANGDLVPAAWSSADASAWTLENPAVPHENGWTAWGQNADVTTGAPAVGPDGSVYTWYSGSTTVWGSVYARRASGEWWTTGSLASASPAEARGAQAALAAGADGRLAVVQHSTGWAAVAQVDEAGWSDRGRLTPRAETLQLGYAADPAPDSLLYMGLVNRLTIRDDSSTLSRTYSETFGLGADGVLAPSTSVPQDMRAAQTATDPDSGARVVVGYVDDTAQGTAPFVLRYQAAADGAWSDIAADLAGLRGMSGLFTVDEGWIALLTERPESNLQSGRDQLVIMTSTDGQQWTRVPADQMDRPEVGGTLALAACSLPDGSTVALGATGTQTPGVTAGAWVGSGGSWHAAAVEGAPAGSSFTSCTATEDGVLATLTASGTSEVWSTSDGESFTREATLPASSTLDHVVTTGDGFAAAGTLTSADHSGPVLWLSADGASWTWVAVPARERIPADLRVDVLGDRLVVTGWTSGGQQMWFVDDAEA